MNQHQYLNNYYGFYNDHIKVNSITQSCEPITIASLDEEYGYIYPKKVCPCEVTFSCSDIVLHKVLNYLEKFGKDKDFNDENNIQELKDEFELKSIKEKYNNLLAETLKAKLPPKYKLKHKVKQIKP